MKNKSVGIFALIVLALTLTVSGTAMDMILKWRAGMDAAGAENRIGERYPLPVQEVPFGSFLGYGAVTATTTAQICPTLPTGTRALMVGCTGGNMNFGNASVPAGLHPFTIASGTYKEFNVTDTTPEIYFRAESSATSLIWLAK